MQQYAAAPEQRAMIAFPLSIKRPFVSYSVSYSVQSGYKATNRHSSHLIIPKGIDEGVHVRKEGRKEGRKEMEKRRGRRRSRIYDGCIYTLVLFTLLSPFAAVVVVL